MLHMKKGQGMSINVLVMAVLGIVVLIIIIMVVRNQITEGSARFTAIGEKADIGSLDKCDNIILGRSCVPQNQCQGGASRIMGTLDCGTEICCQRG